MRVLESMETRRYHANLGARMAVIQISVLHRLNLCKGMILYLPFLATEPEQQELNVQES